ncbi:MAG TPA: hypothetical protein VF188_17535 [Longimicrobiales bacterium]
MSDTTTIACTHPDCEREYGYGYAVRAERPTRWYPGTPPRVEITDATYPGDVPPCGHAQDWDAVEREILERLRRED